MKKKDSRQADSLCVELICSISQGHKTRVKVKLVQVSVLVPETQEPTPLLMSPKRNSFLYQAVWGQTQKCENVKFILKEYDEAKLPWS